MTKNRILESVYKFFIIDVCVFFNIILNIRDSIFITSPPALIVSQSFILWIGSSKGEVSEPVPRIPAYCLPHDQVVGPCFLISYVGCPKLK